MILERARLVVVCTGIGFIVPLANLVFFGWGPLVITHPIFDLIVGPMTGLLVGIVLALVSASVEIIREDIIG